MIVSVAAADIMFLLAFAAFIFRQLHFGTTETAVTEVWRCITGQKTSRLRRLQRLPSASSPTALCLYQSV